MCYLGNGPPTRPRTPHRRTSSQIAPINHCPGTSPHHLARLVSYSSPFPSSDGGFPPSAFFSAAFPRAPSRRGSRRTRHPPLILQCGCRSGSSSGIGVDFNTLPNLPPLRDFCLCFQGGRFPLRHSSDWDFHQGGHLPIIKYLLGYITLRNCII